jgi:hypothetical protein
MSEMKPWLEGNKILNLGEILLSLEHKKKENQNIREKNRVRNY